MALTVEAPLSSPARTRPTRTVTSFGPRKGGRTESRAPQAQPRRYPVRRLAVVARPALDVRRRPAVVAVAVVDVGGVLPPRVSPPGGPSRRAPPPAASEPRAEGPPPAGPSARVRVVQAARVEGTVAVSRETVGAPPARRRTPAAPASRPESPAVAVTPFADSEAPRRRRGAARAAPLRKEADPRGEARGACPTPFPLTSPSHPRKSICWTA